MNKTVASLLRALAFLVLSPLIAGCVNENPPSSGKGALTPDSRQSSNTGRERNFGNSNSTSQPNAVSEIAAKPVAQQNEEAKNQAAQPASGANRTEVEEEKEVPPEKDPPIPTEYKPLNRQKTIFFETTADNKRRVHVLAEVCQRDVMLEVFLCKNDTKEHEAILHANVDAKEIHTALMAAGAKPGSTVKFTPKYVPATGDAIKVSVTYYKDGKLLTKPAQSWVYNVNTKKEMQHDWVFAGSRLFKFPDEPERQPFYCANNGEVIALSNFPDSMLDLPVESSKDNADLTFKAYTERIPPLRTKVLVTLEPVKK